MAQLTISRTPTSISEHSAMNKILASTSLFKHKIWRAFIFFQKVENKINFMV